MSQRQVLIIIGDATETLDTMYPYYRLQEAGFAPVVAAPEKRRYQLVLHEVKPGWTITKEWEGYTLEADLAFADVQPETTPAAFAETCQAVYRKTFARSGDMKCLDDPVKLTDVGKAVERFKQSRFLIVGRGP